METATNALHKRNQARVRNRARSLGLDILTNLGTNTFVELREEGPYLWGYRLTIPESVALLAQVAREKGVNLDPIRLD